MEALARDLVRLTVGVAAEAAAVSVVGLRFARTKLSERARRSKEAGSAILAASGTASASCGRKAGLPAVRASGASAMDAEGKWRRIESEARAGRRGERADPRRTTSAGNEWERKTEVTLMKVACAILLEVFLLASVVWMYNATMPEYGQTGAIVACSVHGLLVVPSTTLAIIWLVRERGRRPGGGGGRRGPRTEPSLSLRSRDDEMKNHGSLASRPERAAGDNVLAFERLTGT